MKHFAAAIVFTLVPFASLAAQTPDTATLLGTIVDPTRAVVVGSEIVVRNVQTGLRRESRSNGQGKFTIDGLPGGGTYAITASKAGFVDASIASATLAGGSTANIFLQMNVAGGQSEVTVSGAAGELRTDQPQLGVRLDQLRIEETPLPNHRITYLPLLNAANRPAINQGDIFMDQNLFTTNGAGRRQAFFEVDGAPANDSWGRQTIFTNLPVSSVEEMTVLTNSFSAEYGAGTGSVVNIVTRSGGDKLHGEVAALWRPAGPEAALAGFTPVNATTGNEVTNDRLVQESFAVGGPVGRASGTRFFLAAEHSDEEKASPVTSPLNPTSFVGVYHGWLGFLRLDHQFSTRNNGFFRGNVDTFFDTNPNGIVGGASLPTVARVFRRRTYTGEFGDTATLRPTLLNSARTQFQLASPVTQFDPVVNGTQFVVPIAGLATFTSGTSQSALLLNHQYGGSDTLTATLGKHQVNFGGDVLFAHTGGNSKEFGGPIYLGRFTYSPCAGPGAGSTVAQIEAYCEGPGYLNNLANVASYTQSYGNGAYTVDDALWSLFVQDDFRATSRLTLNVGLRYERQTFTDAKLNLAPRVGFAYDMSGQGRTVLRGGFGIYYSQVVDNDQANYALTGPTGVFNYTATPGQAGFPASVAAAPLPSFPAGTTPPVRSLYLRPGLASYYNQFLTTSSLVGYPGQLLNPYSEQYTLSLGQQLASNWLLTVDYVGTHQLRNVRPLDVDAPASYTRTKQGQFYGGLVTPSAAANLANCARPYWIAFYAQRGTACPSGATIPPGTVLPPYALIQSDVNDGFLHYDALDVNLHHVFSHGFEALASYTWSHTLDNVDPDIPSQNPNDALQTGAQEYGNAIYDQRHRFVLSGFYLAPLRIHLGGIATLASGLPYNLTTGANNSGDTGATTDRPVINGVLVGRNTGRGSSIYQVDPFVSRAFAVFHERVTLDLRAEAFNALNHPNYVAFNGTYGNTRTASPTLGSPGMGVNAQLPARSLQFSGKVTF